MYGAGGAIGSAVARAFALEGAKLFLTGRQRVSVEAVAKEIVSTGGFAEAAEVDALDEQAIDKHLQSVIDKEGRVDISFNAVGIGGRRFWVCPWSSWTSSGSHCRSQLTQPRTSARAAGGQADDRE